MRRSAGGPRAPPAGRAFRRAGQVGRKGHREFSGIGGISTFEHALNYFLLGCGTVQVATAAMLDHAIGPNVIAALTSGMAAFLERNADRGWTSLADFRGIRRANVVPHSEIGRPGASDYHGGYDETEEGYAGAPAR